MDKILILNGLVYIFVKSDFFPYKAIGFAGSLDDLVMLIFIILIIWKGISPEIKEKTENTLRKWAHRKVSKWACTGQLTQ